MGLRKYLAQCFHEIGALKVQSLAISSSTLHGKLAVVFCIGLGAREKVASDIIYIVRLSV